MRSSLSTLTRWIDSKADPSKAGVASGIDWLRTIPYIGMHLGCLAVVFVGWSYVAVSVALGLYALRMFAITGFYHRYFSHRSFRTSRVVQYIFALIGASSVQRGPIWWAAHHRYHHATTDGVDDPHSPLQHGFFHAHTGWFMTREHFPIREERVRDWMKFPELRFLDRFDIVVPAILAILMLSLGAILREMAPGLGTSPGQMLVWGFCISTVALYHATFSINSLAHAWGKRRYKTPDDSRNSFWLALITFGEGWHNNHHHYPASTRQGFFWWEIDLTYYFLKTLEAFGLVWDLKPVPKERRQSNLINPVDQALPPVAHEE